MNPTQRSLHPGMRVQSAKGRGNAADPPSPHPTLMFPGALTTTRGARVHSTTRYGDDSRRRMKRHLRVHDSVRRNCCDLLKMLHSPSGGIEFSAPFDGDRAEHGPKPSMLM